jgi:hypothetical protein
MWGIPKDSLADEDEQPYVVGEMDRDGHGVFSLDEDHKYSDLGKLAAAYYHGASNVILTERKAYAVTSDEEGEAQALYDANK